MFNYGEEVVIMYNRDFNKVLFEKREVILRGCGCREGWVGKSEEMEDINL